ncbi:Flp family type IVb pilin [Sphingomonas sp. ASV193]|uniref:Flp family type IVb pilin n=1 Tax=Sphingomonas sp. ASV193 TaxID=3144405 RepID=UPI0032E87997
MRRVMKLIRDSRGATAIEYAMIASLVSVAALGAYQQLGTRVDAKYQSINNAM